MQATKPDTAISDEQLVEVVDSVFGAMLGLPITRQSDESTVHGSPQLAAQVQIAGAWNGTVLVVCSEPFGRRAASLMLGVAPTSVKLADVHDAVAELVNIIGGGIKSVLPGPSTLSLPTVTCGSHYTVHMPRTLQAARIEFTCADEPVQLRLLQAAPA